MIEIGEMGENYKTFCYEYKCYQIAAAVLTLLFCSKEKLKKK